MEDNIRSKNTEPFKRLQPSNIFYKRSIVFQTTRKKMKLFGRNRFVGLDIARVLKQSLSFRVHYFERQKHISTPWTVWRAIQVLPTNQTEFIILASQKIAPWTTGGIVFIRWKKEQQQQNAHNRRGWLHFIWIDLEIIDFYSKYYVFKKKVQYDLEQSCRYDKDLFHLGKQKACECEKEKAFRRVNEKMHWWIKIREEW